MRSLLEQPPYPKKEEWAEEVKQEVESRFADRVAYEWMQNNNFPVVVASNHPTGAEHVYSEGLLYWFELREQPGVTPLQQVRGLSTLPADSSFRKGVSQGLNQCDRGDELVIDLRKGPLFSEARESLTGASASLAAAVWGSWYRRGLRPDRPVAVSGEVLEDGRVKEVAYVKEKFSGAREHGVNVLVVPGEADGQEEDGLIRVPCEGRTFKDWLKSCEDYLLKKGVKLVKVPPKDGSDPPTPWLFAPYLEEKCRDFIGRQWMFDEIDAWRTCQQEPALLITGDPGAGKSAIIAQLWKSDAGGRVLAIHCCQADTPETLKPGRFVRSIAAMIAAKLEEYGQKISQAPLSQRLSQEHCDQDPASALEEGVFIPLHEIKAPDHGVRYILIDALNEALHHKDGPNIVNILASRLKRLPPWLRIVATTRSEAAVLERLGSARAIKLNAQDQQNLDDIAEFIQQRLSSPNLAERLAASRLSQEQFTRILLDKSAGNFLYAILAVQGIEADRYKLRDLEQLPPGLGGLYEDFFRSQFSDEAAFAPAKRLLQVVVAAKENLDRTLLAPVTGMELPSVVRTLGSFLAELEGKYKLFHPSLAEWLTDPWQNGSIYTVSTREGHQQLAEAGLSEFRRGVGNVSRYNLAWLPTHLRQTERWQELEELLTNLPFLEAKTGAGKVFDLAEDFRQAVAALPETRPQRRILNLLEEALRRDIHFIHRHREDYPQGLFQCLWNICWWYDCPQAGEQYQKPESGWVSKPPWEQPGPKLFELLERWRAVKAAAEPGFRWMRSRRPPAVPLGSAQIAILSGHTDSITDLAVSTDTRSAASGAEDGAVKVWELATGREMWCSPRLGGKVLDVAFTSDAHHLAAAVEPGAFHAWEIEDFKATHDLHGPGGWQAAIAPGMDAVAFGESSQNLSEKKAQVRLWDLRDVIGRKLERISLDEAPDQSWQQINQLEFSPDGNRLVAGCTHFLGVWDRRKSEWTWRDSFDEGIFQGIWNVSFCPAGLRLAVVLHEESDLYCVKILSAEDGRELACIPTPILPKAINWSADGERLVVGHDDGSISVFNATTWQRLAAFAGHDEEVSCVAFVGPHQILSGSDDRTVRLWDLRRATQGLVLPDPARSLPFGGLESHSKLIASSGYGPTGRVEVWDAILGTMNCSFPCSGATSFGPMVSVSPGGIFAVVADSPHPLLWRIADGVELVEHEAVFRNANVVNLLFSPDGSLLAMGTSDGKVRVWDGMITHEAWIGAIHKGEVWPLEFSPDGKLLASGDTHGVVGLWEARTGRLIRRFITGNGKLNNIEFVGGGGRIAVVNRVLQVWDLDGGTQLQCPSGSDFVFSRSGDLVATAEKIDQHGIPRETAIRRLDKETVTDVCTLPRILAIPLWTAFSHDDQYLIESNKRLSNVWELASRSCIRSITGMVDDLHRLTTGGPARFPYWAVVRPQELAIYSPLLMEELAAVPGSFKEASTLPSGQEWAALSSNHLSIYQIELG